MNGWVSERVEGPYSILESSEVSGSKLQSLEEVSVFSGPQFLCV